MVAQVLRAVHPVFDAVIERGDLISYKELDHAEFPPSYRDNTGLAFSAKGL